MKIGLGVEERSLVEKLLKGVEVKAYGLKDLPDEIVLGAGTDEPERDAELGEEETVGFFASDEQLINLVLEDELELLETVFVLGVN